MVEESCCLDGGRGRRGLSLRPCFDNMVDVDFAMEGTATVVASSGALVVTIVDESQPSTEHLIDARGVGVLSPERRLCVDECVVSGYALDLRCEGGAER